MFEPQSVPAWFAADVRLGQLTIALEPPGCFAAEEYAQVRVVAVHTAVTVHLEGHLFGDGGAEAGEPWGGMPS